MTRFVLVKFLVFVCLVYIYIVVSNNVEYTNKKTTIGVIIPFTPTSFHFKILKECEEKNGCKIYRELLRTSRYFGNLQKEGKSIFDVHSNSEFYIDNVNKMAGKAINDDADYLVLVVNNSLVSDIDIYQINHSIQRLKFQTDIGVVIVGDMSGSAKGSSFITVHKSHFEIFSQFLPNYLDSISALQWIYDVYKPYYCIELNASKPLDFGKLSIPFQFRSRSKEDNLEKDRYKCFDFIVSTRSLSVISYSLFGSSTRYTDGAIANSKLFKTIYPGWKLWVYHDNTVPHNILLNICIIVNVTCINMTESRLPNKMSWRFLIASVPFVTRYIIRDIDSRLSERERAAVDEWIVSGKRFHVMRDHPAHGGLPINGGMWGGTREAIPYLEVLVKTKIMDNKRSTDMQFLKYYVWKIAQKSIYQHDSFYCKSYGGGHPFPSKRNGLEHVGSVFIDGKMRVSDTDKLNKTKAPKECVRE